MVNQISPVFFLFELSFFVYCKNYTFVDWGFNTCDFTSYKLN